MLHIMVGLRAKNLEFYRKILIFYAECYVFGAAWSLPPAHAGSVVMA